MAVDAGGAVKPDAGVIALDWPGCDRIAGCIACQIETTGVARVWERPTQRAFVIAITDWRDRRLFQGMRVISVGRVVSVG